MSFQNFCLHFSCQFHPNLLFLSFWTKCLIKFGNWFINCLFPHCFNFPIMRHSHYPFVLANIFRYNHISFGDLILHNLCLSQFSTYGGKFTFFHSIFYQFLYRSPSEIWSFLWYYFISFFLFSFIWSRHRSFLNCSRQWKIVLLIIRRHSVCHGKNSLRSNNFWNGIKFQILSYFNSFLSTKEFLTLLSFLKGFLPQALHLQPKY